MHGVTPSKAFSVEEFLISRTSICRGVIHRIVLLVEEEECSLEHKISIVKSIQQGSWNVSP
jgi:hypothetical protein